MQSPPPAPPELDVDVVSGAPPLALPVALAPPLPGPFAPAPSLVDFDDACSPSEVDGMSFVAAQPTVRETRTSSDAYLAVGASARPRRDCKARDVGAPLA